MAFHIERTNDFAKVLGTTRVKLLMFARFSSAGRPYGPGCGGGFQRSELFDERADIDALVGEDGRVQGEILDEGFRALAWGSSLHKLEPDLLAFQRLRSRRSRSTTQPRACQIPQVHPPRSALKKRLFWPF